MVESDVRATNVVSRLRRMPVGFYVAMKTENGTTRTLNERASVGKDVVEWDDEIALPSDRSSKMTLAVFASFEFGPTLGNGEVLHEIGITVDELLDHLGQSEHIEFKEQGDGRNNNSSLRSSLEIKVELRAYDQNKCAATSSLLESEETQKIVDLTDSGHHALSRYRELGQEGDLEESVRFFELAQVLCLPGHPNRATVLFNLANAKLVRCRENEMSPNLDESIGLYRDVLRLRPRGHPDRLLTLLSLGIVLLARFQRKHDEADGTEAESLLSEVLDDAPEDGYTYFAAILALGSAAKLEPTETPQTVKKELHDSEDFQRLDAALEQMFRPDSWRPVLLDPLGILFCTRFDRLGDIGNPEKAIPMLEVLVRFIPDDHPDKPSLLDNLGNSLLTRYETGGACIDLEKTISIFEHSMGLAPNSDSDKASRSNNLGRSLFSRYRRSGDPVDLERAISLFDDAVQLIPDGHSTKPTSLCNLGHSLSARYGWSGNVDDLKRSISLTENALQSTPDGHPEKLRLLVNLDQSLFARYERFGDVADLQRSILLGEDVLRLASEINSNKPARLSDLGCSLLTRYERLGDVADLEQSISLFKEAIQSLPDDHPDRPLQFDNLGHALLARYERFGDAVDLEESISLRESALQCTPSGHPAKPSRLNSLASALSVRYERLGDITDLERSISLSEDAIGSTPGGHPDKLIWLSNLSYFLYSCYLRRFDKDDLDRSISLEEDIIRRTPDGHPRSPTCLNNLARSLISRYERLEDIADLERSISLFKDALRSIPDGHPNKRSFLNNLGSALVTRYRCTGNTADLDESIPFFEDAIQRAPDGCPEKLSQLNNLATAFYERFRASLDLSTLALARSTFSTSDLSKAILHSSRAARSLTGPSVLRSEACQTWISCARLLRHESLLDAYTIAIDLLPQLAWIALSLPDRYHQLLEAADVACEAAAAAIDVHRPDLAVEWLEQSRSIVWNQLSQLRTPLDDLRAQYQKLAAQFERMSHELEHATSGTKGARPVDDRCMNQSELAQTQAQRLHALALSRERIVAEIRALPGFERFLLPKTIDQLSSALSPGPIVFLNASEYRCDALVVLPGSENVIHVPLSTDYDEIESMQLRMNQLLTLQGRAALRDDAERGARVRDMTPDDVFRPILAFLWEKVVGPILKVLPLSKSDGKLPRIFWCPTGLFSFLPIHAAGLYGATNTNIGSKLSDFAVSSYIPTMNALELPQLEATSIHIWLLAVPQPSTDGQVCLRGVAGEIETIRSLASSSPFVSIQETDGTVEDVLSKMAETNWVHFACHATQDRDDPYESGIFLAHGRRLKLADMTRLSRQRPREGLAFLSACHTATGDEQLPEEAIHVAAGMLLAGYRSVVATMWTIMDDDAPGVAEDVYRSLFHDGRVPDSGRAAEALHSAVERFRDSGASFLSWVPFVHVGL